MFCICPLKGKPPISYLELILVSTSGHLTSYLSIFVKMVWFICPLKGRPPIFDIWHSLEGRLFERTSCWTRINLKTFSIECKI